MKGLGFGEKLNKRAGCRERERERETYFPQITQTHKEFENKSNFDKLPYLFGEIPHCAITEQQDV